MKKQSKAAAVTEVSSDPMAKYADTLSRIQAILDAQAKADNKPLPDEPTVRNTVFNSLTLFGRGQGYVEGQQLTKDEKSTLKAEHNEFRTAVKQAVGLLATVKGRAVEVTRLGNAKAVGKGKDGVPTHWQVSMTGRYAMEASERKAYAMGESERWARVAKSMAS